MINLVIGFAIVGVIHFILGVVCNSWLWWKSSRAHILGVRAVRAELFQ